MDDVIEVFAETVDPVTEAIKDWCTDAIQNAIHHAPQYAMIALKALKGIL